jgi:hypothetical protein
MANKFTDAMRATAAELEAHPRWHPYAGYYKARANNLREQAATAAEQFAEVAKAWPLAERRQFSLWLMDRTGWIMERCGRSRFVTGGWGLFAPRLVVETVLCPTLAEWRDCEPTNAEPHF